MQFLKPPSLLLGSKGEKILFGLLVVLATIPAKVHSQAADSTLVSRFQLAESYIRGAQFERAIFILEDLVEQSPDTHVFYDRLRSAYEGVKRFDDAIALVDRKMESEAVPTLYLTEKARLLYLKGDEAGAEDTWQQAIETNPNSATVYLLVYRSVMQVRMFDLAIVYLEQGRERLGDEHLFQNDLAFLYGLNSEHDLAMREYLSLLRTSEDQLNFVRSRLSQFIEDEGALETSIAETEDAVAASPFVMVFREILGWLYVEAGRFRDALTVHRAIDQLEDEEGRVLYNFAAMASEAGAYDVAVDAYKEILERYPESVMTPDVVRALGIAQETWAENEGVQVYNESGSSIPDTEYHQALASYYRFVESFPNHVYFPDVLRRIGRLQQDVFYDYDSAERILSEVVTRYPQSRAAEDASFDIARLLLVNDDLVSAEVQFSRIVSRMRTGETADLARFELALIHFYRGQFESALSLASALQENTSADVANDAIQLKLLVSENKGPDSLDTPLHQFAQAKLLKRQRHLDEALSRLDLILEQIGEHPLVDDIRYERAGLLRTLGQSEAAEQAYLELPLIYPESLYADRCLFFAADIQAVDLGDTASAIDTYSRLLDEYPGSLLAPDTRARIRRLRGDGA